MPRPLNELGTTEKLGDLVVVVAHAVNRRSGTIKDEKNVSAPTPCTTPSTMRAACSQPLVPQRSPVLGSIAPLTVETADPLQPRVPKSIHGPATGMKRLASPL